MATITTASATSSSCYLASGASSLRRAVRFSELAKLKTRHCSVASEGSARARARGGGLDREARDILVEGPCKMTTSNLSKDHSQVAGGIVALGKFDALHIGHRELAIQASRLGTPYLLSFTGIAEVLGWEPRIPIVAKCDRERVLISWAQYCGNIVPKECQIEFATVRHLSPREFVEKLAKELGVCGVVAGENYRFGYKAAGDASDLVTLSNECGINAYIINTVMDKHEGTIDINSANDRGQVSSTRVRRALASGDMKYVSELLGRRHRLVLALKDWETSYTVISKFKISASKLCLLNLPPKDGEYRNCSVILGKEKPVSCSVVIDATHIHLETCEVGLFTSDNLAEMRSLGIEFFEMRVC